MSVRVTSDPAEGSSRLMTAADVQLAAEWVADGFHDEFSTVDLDWAERRLVAGTTWFWEVGGTPVSMVAHHHPLFADYTFA